jgi:protein archease
MNTMVEDRASIQPRETRCFRMENRPLDTLLDDFLQELIYHKDAEGLLLRIHEIELERGEGSYSLIGTAKGEEIDPERHKTRVDVKAVNLHNFSVRQTDRCWEAFVILDI